MKGLSVFDREKWELMLACKLLINECIYGCSGVTESVGVDRDVSGREDRGDNKMLPIETFLLNRNIRNRKPDKKYADIISGVEVEGPWEGPWFDIGTLISRLLWGHIGRAPLMA